MIVVREKLVPVKKKVRKMWKKNSNYLMSEFKTGWFTKTNRRILFTRLPRDGQALAERWKDERMRGRRDENETATFRVAGTHGRGNTVARNIILLLLSLRSPLLCGAPEHGQDGKGVMSHFVNTCTRAPCAGTEFHETPLAACPPIITIIIL